jgi:hypothetical protein
MGLNFLSASGKYLTDSRTVPGRNGKAGGTNNAMVRLVGSGLLDQVHQEIF